MSLSWPKIRVLLLKVFSRFYLEVMILSVVAVMAVGYPWFIRRGWEEVRMRRRYNLLQTQTQANYLEGHVADLRRLDEQVSRFNHEHFARFKTLLPTVPDLPGLFVQVAAIADHSGLVVDNLQFGEVDPVPSGAAAGSPEQRPSGGLRSVAMNASVSQGTYASLKQFLTDLESNLRLIDVVSVNFSGGSLTTFLITMQTYYWPR